MTIPTHDGPEPTGPSFVFGRRAAPMIEVMASRVSSPVLIGRRHELARLEAAVERSAGGEAWTILVGGEAGIGKSRLLGELIGRLRGREAIVLEGACVGLGTDEGLPLAPIADALRAIGREIGPEDVAGVVGTAGPAIGRLVPELGTTVDPSELSSRPDWAQARLLEAILGVLQRLAARRPVVLVVEDLHWADSATRDVLTFLARSARETRLLIVVTYRTDELHRRHPLRPWLAEMDRLPRVERVGLERLDRTDLAALLASIGDEAPEPALVEAIARRSEGNPFYAEELLAAGAVRPGDPLPDDLRDVLLSRLGGLTETTRRVLGVASVAPGQSVEHDLLRAAAGTDDLGIEAAMREAMAAGIVVVSSHDGAAGYAFRHALLQEAIRDDLLPTERRRHHLAFADALRARPTASGTAGANQLASLAHHASAAHDLPVALGAWIEAGRTGAESYAFAAAARSFERALEIWEAVPAEARPPGIDLAGLYSELASARVLAGETVGAVEAARTAVERLDPAADPLRAAAFWERLSRAAWTHGDHGLAFSAAAEGARRLEGLPPSETAAAVRAGYAATLMLSGAYRQATEEAEAAIALAEAAGSLPSRLHALNTLGVCLAQLGDCERALAVAREGFDGTLGTRLVHDQGRAYANYSTVLGMCGRAEEGAELSRQGSAWARENGVWRTYGAFHDGNLASYYLEVGRWDEAVELLTTGEEVTLEGVTEMNWAINGGPLAVRRGDLARAHAMLDGVAARSSSFRDAQFSGPLAVGVAELALAEGRVDDAWRVALDGARVLEGTEDALIRAELAATIARIAADRALAAQDRRDPAAANEALAVARERIELEATFLGRLDPTSLMAIEPLLRVDEARAELLRATAPGEAAAAWAGIVARWRSGVRPFPLAYARFREAEAILAGHGDRAAAVAALAEARDLAVTLGARPLLAEIDGLARRSRLRLEQAEGVAAPASSSDAGEATEPPPEAGPAGPADPFGLTGREREVLALVAAGHTNRRIAELLFISESTAGVHVSNILGKLGVAGRAEAAAIAVRLGLDG